MVSNARGAYGLRSYTWKDVSSETAGA